MDELLGMAMWVMMAILAINAALLWVDGNSEIMHIGISDNTFFNSVVDSVQNPPGSSGNYATGETVQGSKQNSDDFTNSFNILMQTITKLYTGWIDLLVTLFGPWGDIGTFFLLIILPVPLLIQAAATALLSWKIAIAIRGVLPF